VSTYLDLTNQLLRRLNEVEIAQADFPSVRGVQATAKDAVKNAIAKINQAEYEWPFNAVQHTQLLVVGQEEYSWPQYLKVADFNSFQLQPNSSLGVQATQLKFIDRDTYYRNFKDLDDNAGATGRAIPTTVAEGFGNGYAVTPSPDQAYTIKFRYYQTHNDLVAYGDLTRVPDTYDNVIIEGALMQMYMFRDNMEAAGISAQLFQQGVKEMQGILMNKYEAIRDTRISVDIRSNRLFI
jgi:hypothetical protein|tara:strand:- start:4771 stop:5484 length:714 start_codon:yes stop_codon:yes gene_type:complete